MTIFSSLWSNSGRISLVVAASSDGEGVKISWALLVPKAGTSSSYGGLDSVASMAIGSEFKLVVRFGDGMGFVYSLLMSSHSKVENIDS